MNNWFITPIVFGTILAFIFACAAVGYNRGRYPLTISINAFSGPVRDYVLPGGLLAAITCIVTILFVERVSKYPPLSGLLSSIAIIFTFCSIIGLVLFQSIENLKSSDGKSFTLQSPAPLVALGVIYAYLVTALVSFLVALILLGYIPSPSASNPSTRAQTTPSAQAENFEKVARNG